MTRFEDDTRLPRASADVDAEERALMVCADCCVTFPQSAIEALEKGTLACPNCGS
jgi:DNA-directed RNA polymerase subunit RPC12/RpoP